jgi:carboxymethylenebutenolidase
VTYYGGSWDPPRDPDLTPAPWLGHWAANDRYEAVGEARTLQEREAQAGAISIAHVYDRTHHWFAEPDRPEYDEAASELAYQRTLEFLHAQLRRVLRN